MKARLMFPDRDFGLQRTVSRREQALMQDLAVDTVVQAMAAGDPFLADVGRSALLTGFANDADTIRYRQAIMDDCLEQATVVRELYALAVEAIERRRQGGYFGFSSKYPSSMLYGSIGLLDAFVEMLRKLRAVADQHASRFRSRGLRRLFDTVQQELGDAYLASVEDHLTTLKFRQGVLISATLGERNQGTDYVLGQPWDKRPTWLRRMFGAGSAAFVFHIHERDEVGARALSELRDRGINAVANAAAQASDHLLSFFGMLRAELAFYVCALNLRDRLAALDAPIAMPDPAPRGSRALRCRGLYDVALALSLGRAPVGNDIDGDGKSLVVITGANQGGKSSAMRAIGLAQLMMQCGVFVGADGFTGELCAGLFTHYTREEDATMQRGKLDEELSRLSDIVDAVRPHAMVLFNESFAATNEHEGSEIATQVVSALLEHDVKVVFVTHLFEFAHGMFDRVQGDTLCLRAERRPDGTRTFRLVPAEPLETSYGEDLYREIFA
jgi:hypothetical protein